jgi:penicillin-binding protein 1A
MVFMMTKVVEEGTGKRAMLDNIKVGGKTGTTNGYKDAWFIGYTGNNVAAVWYGNDDDTSMNNMTGGTLPAATWHEIMAYAHTGIDLKPIPGLPAAASTPVVASAPPPGSPAPDQAAAQRPATLSRASSDILGGIEDLIRSAGGKRADAAAAPTLALAAPGAGPVRREPAAP